MACGQSVSSVGAVSGCGHWGGSWVWPVAYNQSSYAQWVWAVSAVGVVS